MRTLLLFLIIFSTSCHHPTPVAEKKAGESRFELRAEGRLLARGPVLHFVLENRTANTVHLLDRELPWGPNAVSWHESPLLLEARVDGGKRLENVVPVSDLAGPRASSIEAGQTITGDVPLDLFFPALSETIKSRTVIVTWKYSLHSTNGETLGEFTGNVRF